MWQYFESLLLPYNNIFLFFKVDAVFDKNDGDGDGKMTKEEFQTFMEKGRQHKQNQLQQNQT